jgi:hypothetical protein
MTIIQTLHDALFAVVLTVGIAAAVSITFMAAGSLFRRDKAHAAEAARPVATHPTRTDETRVLVRR